ncbi:MAG TPA: hypothetical protein VF771_09025 [Longimicrobiaceae bacterium]
MPVDENDDCRRERRQVPLAPAGEVTLTREPMPRHTGEPRQIHPRRPLPPVPEGEPDE